MKLLFRLIGALIILVVLAVIAVLYYADAIAKSAIEKNATYALGVTTKLDSADVAVFSGQFEMTGLDVANPPGFQTDHFLTLASGGVAVRLRSLRKETVQLPSLNLTGIDVNLERREGQANYRVITDNLKRLESGEKPAEDGKRFIIDEVAIRDVTVHADLLPIGGDLTRVDLGIHELILKDVGSDTPKGLLLAEVANVIVKSLLQAIERNGNGLLPDELLKDLSGTLDGLKELSEMGIELDVGKVFDGTIGKVPDAVGDLGKKAVETVDETIQGLGDLIPGKKKDEDGE